MPRILMDKATDSNNDPIVGYWYTYVAGTSTPQATYSDEDLTSPNAYPVVSSAAGAWGPVYVPDGVYKIDIKDAGGTSLDGYPIDNVTTGSPNTYVTSLADLVASTASYSVGTYIQTTKENYSYEVVSSGEHLTTAGGVKLKLLPDAHGRYHALALNESDLGAACNALFAAGANTHVHIGPGAHTLTTTIEMGSGVGSHLVLSGESHLSTTLTMAAGASMIGINAQTQDESTIKNLRVNETVGQRTCLCFLIGGTSATMQSVWAGNAKTGFANIGANAHWNDCWSEACDNGLIIASRFCDFEVGMTTPNSSVTGGSFHQMHLYDCGSGNAARLAGLFITRFKQANISGVSGTFVVGETVTGGTSGATGVIYSSNGTTTLILDQPGVFTVSETITGGTSGATATVDSTNSNVIRGLNFTGLTLLNNDRNGGIIEGVVGAQIQGRAQFNGTNASGDTAGVRIGPSAQVSLAMDLFDNGPQAGGHSGTGYGLHLDSTASGAIVTCNGGAWTCSQASDQDYAFRRQSGTLTLNGVNVAGNVAGVKDGTSVHTARGCYGTPDSTIDIGTDEVVKDYAYLVADVNNETDTLASGISIGARDVHVWHIWDVDASGTLKSFRRLHVYHESGGTIVGTDEEVFDTGTISAAIVDNTDGTYDVTVTNGSANDQDAYARLEEIINLS